MEDNPNQYYKKDENKEEGKNSQSARKFLGSKESPFNRFPLKM